MPTITRPSGLTITLSQNMKLVEKAGLTRGLRQVPRSWGRSAHPVDSIQSSPENDSLISALQDQEMTLVEALELEPVSEPTPSTGARRRRLEISEPHSTELSLELPLLENAILLLEQEGMYTWQQPKTSATVPQRRSRGAGVRSESTRRIVFKIQLATPASPRSQTKRRGIIEEFVTDKIRAYVFKFIARVAVGQVIKFLERKVSQGFIQIGSPSLKDWKPMENLSTLALPSDRPAKILLFIHGTFTSTVGNFGALACTPWGQRFLASALASYDAVLGYNHITLADDPMANATNLLEAIQSRSWKFPPRVDVIAHSRGGLVYRSLVEQLLPASKWKAYFERAVFVSCTNGGTQLAAPQNWQTLADLYTNLAVAGCKLLGMMPQAKMVTTILAETIKSLGAFVKYCVTDVLTQNAVPGVAAMQPDGDFVRQINETQPDQPTIENSNYYAVVSNFEPSLRKKNNPKELPNKLVFWLRDVVIDQIMKRPNDLMVDVPSMICIDPQAGDFVKDTLDFGKNSQVYHSNYFVQPEVIDAFTRWLPIVEPEQLQTAERSETGLEDAEGQSISPELPVSINSNILVTSADSTLSELRSAMETRAPRHVVINRPHYGATLRYALSSNEVWQKLKGKGKDLSLEAAFDLHEGDTSVTVRPDEPFDTPKISSSARPSTRRAVVMENSRLLGVRDPKEPPLSSDGLLNRARLSPTISALRGHSFTLAAMPPGKKATVKSRKKAKGKTQISCHFKAEMLEEVLANQVTSVDVTISREIIAKLSSSATKATGSAKISPEKQLIIQIIPKLNFDLVENNGRIVIDPPEPDKPLHFYFDVKPTGGTSGEIWVVARQEQAPLVTLILKPRIVSSRIRSKRKTAAESNISNPQALEEPLHELLIWEESKTDGMRYHYVLHSPSLGVLDDYYSDYILGDRHIYINSLYSEIENRWLSHKDDLEAFASELRAYGGQLFDKLFPEKMRRVLWNNRDKIQSILVISSEPFIPWEMVHLKDPDKKSLPNETYFLGQLGLVRWLHGAVWPPKQIKIRKNKAKYIIPEYPVENYVLPEAQKEIQYLEDNFSATPIEAKAEPIRKAISVPGGFDLLHFAGHGEAESQNINMSSLLLQGRVEKLSSGEDYYIKDCLKPVFIEEYCDWQKESNRPLVVINACQSGRLGYNLSSLGGFAEAFLKAGAGAFVGSLWSIGDSPARYFTETLYEKLLKGEKLSQAVISARSEAKKDGDATWLAYTVYGLPYLRIKKD